MQQHEGGQGSKAVLVLESRRGGLCPDSEECPVTRRVAFCLLFKRLVKCLVTTACR